MDFRSLALAGNKVDLISYSKYILALKPKSCDWRKFTINRYPLTRPFVTEESKRFAMEALTQHHQQGDGNFCKRATQLIAEITNHESVLLTPSCTSSLELASMLIELGPGDEVIMPSFNFTSAATSVTQFGAIPVFVDINPETKCLDANQIEENLTNRTKAISFVNYAGFTPDLDEIKNVALANKIVLIEDNAHGLGSFFNNKQLGTTGDFVTYSFHATKNIQCGEGGAIGLRNKKDFKKAHFMREKGTNRLDFLEGREQKYTWVERGSSYLLSEIQAAVLYGQLLRFEDIQMSRKMLYARYAKNFKEISENDEVFGNFSQPERGFACHLFYFEVSDEKIRDSLIEFLRQKSITATFHYQALHESKAGKMYGKASASLKFSEAASRNLIRLPLYVGMTEQDVDNISGFVLDFFN